MEPFPGRYNTDGPWLKGNTHIHTTRSDGSMDYRSTAHHYAATGYDFIVITDHRVPADIERLTGLPLLAVNGIEIDAVDAAGAYFHAVGLGCAPTVDPDAPFEEQAACVRAGGGLLILAHPQWTGNSAADSLRHGFGGVEVFNNVCRYMNGKGLGTYHYDKMLAENPATLGFAADDCHFGIVQPYDSAWIMVCARQPSKEAIMAAIRSGNFYATRGPVFESIHADGRTVRVRTSPVQIIRITDNTSWGRHLCNGGEALTEAEFALEEERAYLRVEIEDQNGRTAWTNAVLRGRPEP